MKTFIITMLLSMNLFAHYSQKTLDQVASNIDDMCMDTFCGGDFNYYSPTLTNNKRIYTLHFRAEDWYEGSILQESMNKELPISSTYKSDWDPTAHYVVEASNLLIIRSIQFAESYWEEKTPQIVATFQCQFEMIDNEMSEDDFAEAIYTITLDCVDAFEANL